MTTLQPPFSPPYIPPSLILGFAHRIPPNHRIADETDKDDKQIHLYDNKRMTSHN